MGAAPAARYHGPMAGVPSPLSALRAVLELVPAAAWIVDVASGRAVAGNERARALPGIPRERVEGREFRDGGRLLRVTLALETARPAEEVGVRDRLSSLSKREREVLALIAVGLSSRAIARRLGIGIRTVETHRAHLSEKLDLKGTAALTRAAIEAGLA